MWNLALSFLGFFLKRGGRSLIFKLLRQRITENGMSIIQTQTLQKDKQPSIKHNRLINRNLTKKNCAIAGALEGWCDSASFLASVVFYQVSEGTQTLRIRTLRGAQWLPIGMLTICFKFNKYVVIKKLKYTDHLFFSVACFIIGFIIKTVCRIVSL